MTAVRETEEETGLVLDPATLRPIGYERFRRETHTHQGLWVPGRDILQGYATRLPSHAPPLRPEHPDQAPPEWVDDAEFARRCDRQFWWPLAQHVLGGV